MHQVSPTMEETVSVLGLVVWCETVWLTFDCYFSSFVASFCDASSELKSVEWGDRGESTLETCGLSRERQTSVTLNMCWSRMRWALVETMGYRRTRGLAAFVSLDPSSTGPGAQSMFTCWNGQHSPEVFRREVTFELGVEGEKMVIWRRNSIYPHLLSLSLLL